MLFNARMLEPIVLVASLVLLRQVPVRLLNMCRIFHDNIGLVSEENISKDVQLKRHFRLFYCTTQTKNCPAEN